MLNGMNISYSSDEYATPSIDERADYSRHIQIAGIGPQQFYRIAEELVGPDPFLLQQRGIFEMTHAGGSFDLAERYLDQAAELRPRDHTIMHSQAELLRKRAANSVDSLERAKLRQRASEKLAPLLDRFGSR